MKSLLGQNGADQNIKQSIKSSFKILTCYSRGVFMENHMNNRPCDERPQTKDQLRCFHSEISRATVKRSTSAT